MRTGAPDVRHGWYGVTRSGDSGGDPAVKGVFDSDYFDSDYFDTGA